MYNSKYSNRSSSGSSEDSNHHSPANRFKSPAPSDYEYLGRLVTRERPIIRKPKSIQQNFVFPQNTQKYHPLMRSHRQETYEQAPDPSSDDDMDDPDDINRPLGVIRISDRHFREIYRLPTPPPKVKRVYHRLRSPEPKIIERVFVQRSRPQIIENIIEVPPEKVRIINKEKYLEQPPPITRSKLVHLKSRHPHHYREEEGELQQQQRETFIPSEQYSQQQLFLPSEQYSQQQQQQQATTVPVTASQSSPGTTTLVYPPQPNLRTVGYIKSTVPPDIMFNSQQPLQVSAQPTSNQAMVPSTPYDHPPQQTTNYQMVQPTAYTHPPQQTANYQMIQPTPYTHPPQQTPNYQMIQPTPHTHPPQQTPNYQMIQPTPYTYSLQHPVHHHQMVHPTPYTYPSQPAIPNSPYGYPQY